MGDKDIAKAKTKQSPPRPSQGSEASDWSDYMVGTVYTILGVAFAIWLGRLYWEVHGGNIDTFSFWTTNDKKWLEVLFWSFFTAHAWNMTDAAYAMWNRDFQKRYIWAYVSRIFEAPPISLALVFVVMNLGVAFGGATISLKEAPILVVIAFAIISAYFSRQTVEALQSVAIWLSNLVRSKLNPKDGMSDNTSTPGTSGTSINK
jgi:hypothetical protein